MRIMLTTLVLGIAGCTAEGTAQPAQTSVRPVRVAVVTSGPAMPAIVAYGVLAAHDEPRLSFKVSGVIERITVREGDAVRPGQVLAELEQTEIVAAVAQARSAHEKSQRDLDRGRRLIIDNLISASDLSDLQTLEETARAQLAATEYNARHSAIRATAPGRVLRRLAEEREFVNGGTTVIALSTSDRFVLRASVTGPDFVRLHLGDVATIRLDAFPNREFRGRLTELSGAADARTGTFPIEITLEQSQPGFASGLIGRARIVNDTAGEPRTYVPLAALVEGDQARAMLFTLVGNVARSSQVAVAFVSSDSAALLEALPAGTQVITQGAPFLRDGERVRVVP